MLVSSYPWPAKKGPRVGAGTTSFNTGSLNTRTISNIPVLGPDLLVLMWGRINNTTNPPQIGKFFLGSANTFPVFTNDVWVGPWGTTTGRSTYSVFHYRNPTPALLQSITYEWYAGTVGTLSQFFQDVTLCFLNLFDWDGLIGAEAHGQNTASGATATATITPVSNNSLLLGVGGFQDNNAAPLAASSGWDTIANVTVGAGGSGVDSAVGFWKMDNPDTTNKTLTVSTAGALSAPAGYAGILELY